MKSVKLLILISISLLISTVYFSSYSINSILKKETTQPEGYDWYTREFSAKWQIKIYKPVIFFEDLLRDGDFSWKVRER